MTQYATSPDSPLPDILGILKPRWGWIVASGVVTLLFGLLAFFMPLGAVFAMTMLFGAYAFADGILSVIAAIRARQGLAGAVSVVLGLAIPVILLQNPGAGLVTMGWLIGFYALPHGILEVGLGLSLRRIAR